MTSRGLLFIPDISGFTRFINETEIEHSRLIIQELLELLINSNELGLEISEIEGDAILFYKYGDCPDLRELYQQVEKMFTTFHRNLIAYEDRKYCQCKACTSARQLTLKVITHYGEFAGYNVRNFNKLLGKDVIVAHQLLKNDIEGHDYWLVTSGMVRNETPGPFTEWMEWNSGSRQTDEGRVEFHYTPLTDLRKTLQADTIQPLHLENKLKVISLTKEYAAGILNMFHAIGNFQYRHRWMEGVKGVEEMNHFLPRVGMRCKAQLENGSSVMYSSSYRYDPTHIEFSETEEGRGHLSYFTIEQLEEGRIRLTIDYYIPKKFPSGLLFRLLQKGKIETKYRRSMTNLETLVQEIHLPATVEE